MRSVALHVQDVVEDVRSARRSAVGQQDFPGGEPASGVREFRCEDRAGKDEKVLGPLTRPEARRYG
jgi:hypothetical protein